MNFNKGDILVASWGYDQTNINFYEVIRVTKSMVVVRELAQERKDDTCDTFAMTGTCIPKKGEYIGREMRKKVYSTGSNHDDRLWIMLTDYSAASLWNGLPVSFTTYA